MSKGYKLEFKLSDDGIELGDDDGDSIRFFMIGGLPEENIHSCLAVEIENEAVILSKYQTSKLIQKLTDLLERM